MDKAVIAVAVLLCAAVVVYVVMVTVYALQGCNDDWPCWSQDASLAYLHATLKGVYALTLKRNAHKTQHIQNVMGDLGLKGKLWYGHDAKTQGVRGVCGQGTRRSDGELGCSLSHVAIWKDILRGDPHPSDWFLIFEDDALPGAPKEDTLSKMAQGLKRSAEEGYRLVYFGFTPSLLDGLKGKRMDKHRWRLKCGGTYAYALQASFLPALIDAVERKMCDVPLDLVMSKHLKEPGVVVAMDAFQPLQFFKQFTGKRRGVMGHKRDGEFLSDIVKR